MHNTNNILSCLILTSFLIFASQPSSVIGVAVQRDELDDQHLPLPSSVEAKKDSLTKLFFEYGTQKGNDSSNNVILEEGLTNLLVKIGYQKKDDHDHGDHHDDDDHAHGSDGENHEHGDHDDDNHSEKAGSKDGLGGNATNSSSAPCYTSGELISIFDTDQNSGMNITEFETMLPTLVETMETGNCLASERDDHDHGHSEESCDSAPSKAAAYGWSFLSVGLITMLAMIGIVFLPVLRSNEGYYARITMSCFIALAVGTMWGDAILHLLPQAWGIHDHGDEGCDGTHNHDHDEGDHWDFLWKGSFALVGFQFLFIIEKALHWSMEVRSRKCLHSHGDLAHSCANDGAEQLSDQVESVTKDVSISSELKEGGNLNQGERDYRQDIEIQNLDNNNKDILSAGAPPLKQSFFDRISNLGWMILFGDGVHNFVDGVAIGASFATSLELGLSTAIAVFLHEIPQELADYVILVASGFGKYEALLANFISACGAFIGIFLGIELSSSFKPWVLAFAAGNFIYIGLVDLLPELTRREQLEKTHRGRAHIFILSQLFMMLGYTIMILIARYGES
eukprot:Nk52_evm7s390 gene=Nk52_evmTU7s390